MLAEIVGKPLDPWQELVLQAACGERANGKWAATDVGLSVPRQNGKSLLLAARAVAGAIAFGERKIMVTAHMQDTTRGMFEEISSWIDTTPALAKRIAPNGVYDSLTREKIIFANGAEIQFKSRRKGRGFSCDLLILDEAQILSRAAWASINSTRAARVNPQIWLVGTPPTPEDDGAVFQEVRDNAIAGKNPRTAYLEWSAETDDEPGDEQTWIKANPAYHTRLNRDVIESEYATYAPAQFARERLGIWDEVIGGVNPWRVINREQWEASTITADQVPVSDLKAYGVKFSTSGEYVAAAVGVKGEDGNVHIEALDVEKMPTGSRLLVPWLAERCKYTQTPIIIDGLAGATDFAVQLAAAGVKAHNIRVLNSGQAIAAHSGLLRALDEGSVTHLEQPGLTTAARVCIRRKIGQAGGFGWQSGDETIDITPLDAVTLAHWGAEQLKPRQQWKGRMI